MAKVTVVAHLRAKAGMEDRVREELLKMVAETRKEEGCINYDLHEEIDQPGQFVFYENWTSAEALERHTRTPHYLHLTSIAPEVLDGASDVRRFSMISQPVGQLV